MTFVDFHAVINVNVKRAANYLMEDERIPTDKHHDNDVMTTVDVPPIVPRHACCMGLISVTFSSVFPRN